MAALETCPGCGISLPTGDGPRHPYIGASASCWDRYGELLAREFGDVAYFRIHQVTVDAYAVQHPGKPERRAIQSVGLHLMTLGLFVEHGADPSMGPALHRRLIGRPQFQWLEPPAVKGRLTVLDPLTATTAEAHREAVGAWARDVWDTWSAHHKTVRGWLAESLASSP